MPKGAMVEITLLAQTSPLTKNNPGLAYVEVNDRCRTKVDFAKLNVVGMRVVICASGNEAGAGKGIEVYDLTGAQGLCEILWDGAGVQYGVAGAWTYSPIPTVDSQLTARCKGSSVDEDISVMKVVLQIFYA